MAAVSVAVDFFYLAMVSVLNPSNNPFNLRINYWVLASFIWTKAVITSESPWTAETSAAININLLACLLS